MTNGLIVDFEGIAEVAQKLREQGEIMDESNGRVESAVNSLSGYWTAETANKYIDQYESIRSGLNDAVQVIFDMAEQLTQISNNFRDLDDNMAGQM